MAKQLRIEVSGGIVMYADLLEDLAPQTCAALEKALPYKDKVLSHAFTTPWKFLVCAIAN